MNISITASIITSIINTLRDGGLRIAVIMSSVAWRTEHLLGPLQMRIPTYLALEHLLTAT